MGHLLLETSMPFQEGRQHRSLSRVHYLWPRGIFILHEAKGLLLPLTRVTYDCSVLQS